MDWNNDGKINSHDYALYKTVISSGNEPIHSNKTTPTNHSGSNFGWLKWVIGGIILYILLK